MSICLTPHPQPRHARPHKRGYMIATWAVVAVYLAGIIALGVYMTPHAS